MRPAKALGLIAALALVAAVSLGAGTASATVLCEIKAVEVTEGGETFLGCPEGALYGTDLSEGDTISGALAPDSPQGEGESPAALFESELGPVKCASSEFKAGLKSSGTPIEGTTTSLTYGSCTTTIPTCSVTSVTASTPFTTSVEFEGVGASGKNATITVVNPKTSIKLSCFFGGFKPTCTYQGGSEGSPLFATGEYYDDENENAPSEEEGGIVDLNDLYSLTQAEGSGAGLCPEAGTMRATYAVAAPSSVTTEVNVAQQPTTTKLCKEAPTVQKEGAKEFLECPKGKGYEGVVEGKLEGTATAKFETTGFPPFVALSCGNASIGGDFEENGGPPTGVTNITYSGVSGKNCGGTFGGEALEVAVQIVNLPFDTSYFIYKKDIAPEGELVFAGAKGDPVMRLEIFKGKDTVKCDYIYQKALNTFTNSVNALELDITWAEAPDSLPLCEPRLRHTALFRLKAVEAKTFLWIARQ